LLLALACLAAALPFCDRITVKFACVQSSVRGNVRSMLYLLEPSTRLAWTNMPTDVVKLAREQGVDLASLDWEPSERVMTDDMLRIALREGVACSRGLVVSGVSLAEEGRGDEIRQAGAAARAAHEAIRPQVEVVERAIYGKDSAAQRADLDARVAASNERAAVNADDDLREQLKQPVRNELVEHWRRLGGRVPEPA